MEKITKKALIEEILMLTRGDNYYSKSYLIKLSISQLQEIIQYLIS